MRRAAIWVAGALSLMAQTPTIKVDTREVDVDVTVTDSKGVAVHDLTQGDFTLLDDGKPRTISAFGIVHDFPAVSAVVSTSPLHPPTSEGFSATAPSTGHSSAIILDEANTFFEDAATARQQVMNLFGMLPTDERVALYVIVRREGLKLLRDYTTDREALRASLAAHKPNGMLPTPTAGGGDQPQPPFDARPVTQADAEAMWQANSDAARLSLQAIADQLASVPGRKSLYWVTNAFPGRLLHEMGQIAWDKTFATLNRANVAVNTIDSRGLYRGANPPMQRRNGVMVDVSTISAMQQVAEKTGGTAYFGRNDMDAAIAQNIDASRTTYSLRFQLSETERDNLYHSLKVQVDRKGLTLLYRQGYDAGAKAKPSVDLVADRIAGQALERRAADVPSNSAAANVTMQLPWFYSGTNRASVHLALDMPAASGELELVGVALRSDGSEAARFADTVSGRHYDHMFTLAAGEYTFRISIGMGADAAVRSEMPLKIEPWSAGGFAIGGIALSTQAQPADAATNRSALVAAGKQFEPAATNRFRATDHVYFYTEVRDASPSGLTMQVRTVQRGSDEVKLDSGAASIANYVRPGNDVVAFATALPVAQLSAGRYRLELKAAQASQSAIRTVDFEIVP